MVDAVPHRETDVLVVGSGGAGMYAAIAAARGGAKVLLLDKSLVGRGGGFEQVSHQAVQQECGHDQKAGNENCRMEMGGEGRVPRQGETDG